MLVQIIMFSLSIVKNMKICFCRSRFNAKIFIFFRFCLENVKKCKNSFVNMLNNE